MGWGFSFKKIFSKRGIQSFLGTGGLLPGVDIAITQDKGNEIYEGIHKGIANLLTGGYIGQREAAKQSKKARDEAAAQYAAEKKAAEETARKIAEAEEERKRRLAAQGATKPQTLYRGYLGLPNTGGKSLLG